MNNGWIKIHRKIKSWDWYQDANTFRVFIHLLVSANHKEGSWRGNTIKIGEVLTGRKSIAEQLNISEQNVRTALKHLKLTNEITIKPTKEFSIIKLNNWNDYQQDNQQGNQDLTNDQPTSNQPLTTNKKNKKNKNEKKVISKDIKATPKKSYGDENINKILLALKQKIGIDDFRDTQEWSRKYGRHLLSLMKKLGKEEFLHRLDTILDDSFKRKNCNSIKFVYNEIKGFINSDTSIKSFN